MSTTTALQDRSAFKRKREAVDDEDIALLESPTKKAKLDEKTESVTDPAPLAGEETHIAAASTIVNDSSMSYDKQLLEVFPSLLFAEKKLDAHYFPVSTDNPLLLVIPYIEDLKFLLMTLGSVSKQTRALVFKPGLAWTKTFRRIFGSDNFDPESIVFSSEFKNYKKEFKKDTAHIAFDDTTNISPAVYVDRISQYKSKDWSFEEFDGCPLWEEDGYVDFHIDFFGDAFWYAHAEGCGRAGEYYATNDFFGEGRLIVRSKAWLKGKENIFYDEEPRSEEDDEDEEESDDGSHSDDENEDDEDSETKEKDPKNFQEKKNEKSRLATNATEVEKEDSLAKQSELKKADDEKRAKEKLEEKRRIAQMTPKQRCLCKNFGGKLPTRSDGTETGIYLLSPDSKEIQGGRLIYDLSSNMEW